jgi:hypothetical protein
MRDVIEAVPCGNWQLFITEILATALEVMVWGFP